MLAGLPRPHQPDRLPAGRPDPQGAVGIAEKTILIDSLAIMLAIVIPTIARDARRSPGGSGVQHARALPAGLGLFRRASKWSSGRSRC